MDGENLTTDPKGKTEKANDSIIQYDAVHVTRGMTVYKIYDKDGPSLWDCLLESMGKM